MKHTFYSLLISVTLFLTFCSYAEAQLIIQCEFTDFFHDFKISGALGFKSDHPFIKKIYADTTMVGLMYHPLIGFHCGAMPTSAKDNEKKKGIARGLALMWPIVLNGIRDKTIQNYHATIKNLTVKSQYLNPIKEDYSNVVAMADMILSDYSNDIDLIQKMYHTVQESSALTADKKQKEILQRQGERLAVFLGKNKHKGIS